jgi:hypothetical protein
MLRVIKRLVEAMQEGADPVLTRTRTVTIESITDTHNHSQFQGDVSPEHPTLYNREVLAILPFQANAHKFVIPYYVITRDVTRSLAPESYTVRLSGLNGKQAVVRAYDPLQDKAVAVKVRSETTDSLTVTLTAADYPRLLIVQER